MLRLLAILMGMLVARASQAVPLGIDLADSVAAQAAVLIGLDNGGDTSAVRVQRLDSPILLPLVTDPKASASLLFQTLNKVPRDFTSKFAPSDRTILDALKTIEGTIELSTPKLSEEQQASLSIAYAYLYKDKLHAFKADVYVSYLDFERRYNEQLNELKKATTSADKTVAQAELRNIDRDWQLEGHKAEVKNSLSTIARLSNDNTDDLLESWRRGINPEGEADYTRFWPAIASSSDWVTVSYSAEGGRLSSTLALSVQLPGSNPQVINVRRPSNISMQVLRFKISRPVLEHPFLRTANWQSKSSYILSDGSSADTEGELLPRYVAAVLLVRSIELRFDSESDWQKVAIALAKGADVLVGGLPLRSTSGSSVYVSPMYVSLSGPIAVAAITVQVPRIPSPSPTDEWPTLRW